VITKPSLFTKRPVMLIFLLTIFGPIAIRYREYIPQLVGFYNLSLKCDLSKSLLIYYGYTNRYTF
jgi:hypothetical protein